IYQQKSGGEKLQLAVITDFSNLFNNQIIFTWASAPGPGVWTLTAEVKTKDGSQTKDEIMTVVVE
ncbi:MAG: hypothetical protein HY980_02355, partial [Candidatus Magasanikbacteria bacterium]|nr:hypothetical protein [Candidatus Magasanikbacteria bacterium]